MKKKYIIGISTLLLLFIIWIGISIVKTSILCKRDFLWKCPSSFAEHIKGPLGLNSRNHGIKNKIPDVLIRCKDNNKEILLSELTAFPVPQHAVDDFEDEMINWCNGVPQDKLHVQVPASKKNYTTEINK